ncbi:hypothetical protein FS749_004267 [Ceratobasidium sp. UAMH 11750]|nr:hypothetical protein FS749_004267 [Ceratobasidium sp. UAMH 11750]
MAKYIWALGPVAFGMTYDVWCQWFINFLRRALRLPDDISLPEALDLIGAVPKWHLVGHDLSCHIRHNLDHKQYVGRMEGEGPERVWAHMNEHAGSTSEQGPGTRTDNLNNMAYEWNFEKMINLSRSLPPKFREAKKALATQKTRHEDLSASLPANQIKLWETESIEPYRDEKGNWTSPLVDPIINYGSFQSSIREARNKESPTARAAGRRPGATRWLSEGIELEHCMRNLQDEAKAIGSNPTPRQASTLNTQRMAFRDRVLVHQKRRTYYMPGLDPPDHPEYEPPRDEDLENVEIVLPSSYSPETIEVAGLSSLANSELGLREGACGDSVESTKQLLGAKSLAINHKKRHVRGEMATTRSEAVIRRHGERISKAQWRYENSRKAIIRLGAPQPVQDKYPELKKSDLVPLQSYMEDVSRGVGQGHVSAPWIWRSQVAPNVDDWVVEALKPEWFRSRERWKRWEEQLVLLKREMVMAIRSFRKLREIWLWKSERDNSTPGMKAYARKRSAFYAELAERMWSASKESLYDDVVTFNWCNDWLKNNVNDPERPVIWRVLNKAGHALASWLVDISILPVLELSSALLHGTKTRLWNGRMNLDLEPAWRGYEKAFFGVGGYQTYVRRLQQAYGTIDRSSDALDLHAFENVTDMAHKKSRPTREIKRKAARRPNANENVSPADSSHHPPARSSVNKAMSPNITVPSNLVSTETVRKNPHKRYTMVCVEVPLPRTPTHPTSSPSSAGVAPKRSKVDREKVAAASRSRRSEC